MKLTGKQSSRSYVRLSDGTQWPADNIHTRGLARKIHHDFGAIDRADCLVIANIIDAYFAILDGPQYQRNAQIKAIRNAIAVDQHAVRQQSNFAEGDPGF